MIVAGEPSGDAHAAALVNALRKREPRLECFGATGPLLRAEGVELRPEQERSEGIALIAYLQGLGLAVKDAPMAALPAQAGR